MVVHPVSLHIAASQTVALIGPSGSGKTTLLRMILGLLQPDAGEVLFAGKRVMVKNVLDVRRQIGYMVQNGGLFPPLTVFENVSLVARNCCGWSDARVARRFDQLLELVRLSKDIPRRYPAELSGGQQQRVGIMRGLMLDPPLIVLDEPLGSLDPMVRNELQTDLRQIFQELKKAVFMVTHDIFEANYIADTIALMNAGKILQLGPMIELLQNPVEPFVSAFLEAQRRELNLGAA